MSAASSTKTLTVLIAAAVAGIGGCKDGVDATAAATGSALPAAHPIAERSGQTLHMRIDGVVWTADHDIFGAFHPPGYDRYLIVAGSAGPKNAHEQAFNLNLSGIDTRGRYRVRSGNAEGHAAQFANYSAERFLAGGPFGFDVEVDVIAASQERIEVRFAGTLTANDGTRLTLTDGYFHYHP